MSMQPRLRRGSGEQRQKTVLTRLIGAAFRALCVAFVLAMPAVLLPYAGHENREIIALLALCAGGLVFVEYASAAPSILEFRDAPPFNRTRFLSLSVTLLLLTLVMRDPTVPSPLHDLLYAFGFLIGDALDFAFSPVRLLLLALGERADLEQLILLRTAAGLAMATALIALGIALAVLRLSDWPARGRSFNLWINLPTFDANGGRDIVERLQWDGRLNIGLGVLLPFIIPVLLRVADAHVLTDVALTPHATVWIVTGWSMMPLILVMRGVALSRLANMIADQRRRASIAGDHARLFAL